VPTIDIDFDWTRSFEYELAPSKKGPVIRQKGARTERTWPLKTHASLYLDFSRLDRTPEACLDFCRRWGFLRNKLAGKGAEEEVDEWIHSISHVRNWIAVLNAGLDQGGRKPKGVWLRQQVASVDVLLETHPLGRQLLQLRPKTLMDAMLLQMAQAFASGAAIAACQQCGQWFEVGGEGKRSVAKFCSDKCRNRFNYEQRAKS
jgi:hypothetical protein